MPTDSQPQFVDIEGTRVRLTHLDKRLFEDDGITKAEVLRHYADLAPVLLPHISGRPLTVKAFPHGTTGRPYYRKWLAGTAPDWLSRAPGDEGDMPVVSTVADLMWVANQDSIELHPWLSRSDDLEHPDQVLFDLDPGAGVDDSRLCDAALVVNEVLGEIGITSFPKTSGSKGFHLLIGIERRYSFDEARTWVMSVAKVIADHRPDMFTTGYAQRDRARRVLLDYNQVGRGRTTASLYSIRPYPGAPVSTPVSWKEIEERSVGPQTFNIGNLPGRLAERGDIAAALLDSKQKLPLL